MTNSSTERRRFLKQSVSGLGVYASLTLPGLHPSQQTPSATPLQVVCVGGHPDDPETGCGGTLALYAEAGHQVTIVYLTRGEAGIFGKTHQQAAGIRTVEASKASQILGATPVFAGQIDGDTVFDQEQIRKMQEILRPLQPDVVFTHWPIDTHPDHQVASLLTCQCWLRMDKAFAVYYFEVDSGYQTMQFAPTHYVDITSAEKKKKQALDAHQSQHPEEIYTKHHHPMQQFRGREIGVQEAEAFVLLGASKAGLMV